jgi:DNA-binding response OmpR family regulator
MTTKILLVENSEHAVRPLGKLLSGTFQVTVAESVAAAVASSASSHYSATLLSGEMAGLFDLVADVCTLRAAGFSSVLVLSDDGAGVNLAKLLEAGAWDCLSTAIAGTELIARTNSLIRWSRKHDFAGHRANPDQGAEVIVGNMRITPSSQSVTVDGRDLRVSQREFDLLLALARRSGEVVTRRALMESLWGTHLVKQKRTTIVNVYLNRLRNRLGETVSNPRYLHTVYGAGVKLEAPRLA